MNQPQLVDRFRALHAQGTFVMPNPHDVGAARILTAIGFPALATTSSGFAMSLGRFDATVTRDELVAHVTAICASTDAPVNVDSERCYPGDPGGVEATIEMLAAAGAAGCSLEDFNPVAGHIEPLADAVETIRRAAQAAARVGIVLTARAENHIRGVDDFEDTLARLVAYREAGAEVVYAPGLVDLGLIRRVVDETNAPVNVLQLPGGPSVAELADAGVRRISLGSVLSNVAYGAFAVAAQRLFDEGTVLTSEPRLSRDVAAKAFGPR